MEELKKDILEQLRCSECNNYLSQPPILLRSDGKSICGRCPVMDDDKFIIHNTPFELIASTLYFPCQYEKAGCRKKTLWEHVTDHEFDCEYRQINCPFLPIGSCSWTGSRSALLIHFDKVHPDYVLPHPCSPKPNLEKDCEKNFLMMAFGFLFLVQFRVSRISSKLWYCVRYIGKSSFASVFEYHLHMTGQFQESITKTNIVHPQERYTIHKENSVELDLKQLQRFLGNYEDINLTIEIKIKETICLNCKKDITSFPIYLSIQGTFCGDCKTEYCTEVQEKALYACKYPKCTYFGTAESLPKHELWFCIFNTNPCYLCSIQLRNRSMIEHWKQSHVQTIHCADTMFHDNLKIKTLYVSELNVFDAIFFCWWQYDMSSLEFKVVSNLPKEKIKNFICEVKMCLSDKSIKLKEHYLDQNYDWSVDTKVAYRKSYAALNTYKIEFCIRKIESKKTKSKTSGKSLFYYK